MGTELADPECSVCRTVGPRTSVPRRTHKRRLSFMKSTNASRARAEGASEKHPFLLSNRTRNFFMGKSQPKIRKVVRSRPKRRKRKVRRKMTTSFLKGVSKSSSNTTSKARFRKDVQSKSNAENVGYNFTQAGTTQPVLAGPVQWVPVMVNEGGYQFNAPRESATSGIHNERFNFRSDSESPNRTQDSDRSDEMGELLNRRRQLASGYDSISSGSSGGSEHNAQAQARNSNAQWKFRSNLLRETAKEFAETGDQLPGRGGAWVPKGVPPLQNVPRYNVRGVRGDASHISPSAGDAPSGGSSSYSEFGSLTLSPASGRVVDVDANGNILHKASPTAKRHLDLSDEAVPVVAEGGAASSGELALNMQKQASSLRGESQDGYVEDEGSEHEEAEIHGEPEIKQSTGAASQGKLGAPSVSRAAEKRRPGMQMSSTRVLSKPRSSGPKLSHPLRGAASGRSKLGSGSVRSSDAFLRGSALNVADSVRQSPSQRRLRQESARAGHRLAEVDSVQHLASQTSLIPEHDQDSTRRAAHGIESSAHVLTRGMRDATQQNLASEAVINARLDSHNSASDAGFAVPDSVDRRQSDGTHAAEQGGLTNEGLVESVMYLGPRRADSVASARCAVQSRSGLSQRERSEPHMSGSLRTQGSERMPSGPVAAVPSVESMDEYNMDSMKSVPRQMSIRNDIADDLDGEPLVHDETRGTLISAADRDSQIYGKSETTLLSNKDARHGVPQDSLRAVRGSSPTLKDYEQSYGGSVAHIRGNASTVRQELEGHEQNDVAYRAGSRGGTSKDAPHLHRGGEESPAAVDADSLRDIRSRLEALDIKVRLRKAAAGLSVARRDAHSEIGNVAADAARERTLRSLAEAQASVDRVVGNSRAFVGRVSGAPASTIEELEAQLRLAKVAGEGTRRKLLVTLSQLRSTMNMNMEKRNVSGLSLSGRVAESCRTRKLQDHVNKLLSLQSQIIVENAYVNASDRFGREMRGHEKHDEDFKEFDDEIESLDYLRTRMKLLEETLLRKPGRASGQPLPARAAPQQYDVHQRALVAAEGRKLSSGSSGKSLSREDSYGNGYRQSDFDRHVVGAIASHIELHFEDALMANGNGHKRFVSELWFEYEVDEDGVAVDGEPVGSVDVFVNVTRVGKVHVGPVAFPAQESPGAPHVVTTHRRVVRESRGGATVRERTYHMLLLSEEEETSILNSVRKQLAEQSSRAAT